MFGLGAPEMLVIMVLALLVFGPSKLPEMMASVGQAIREFQRASRELTEVFQETQQEVQSALDLDEQHQTQPAATYEAPAEEVAAAPEPPPVTAQPEEFETAAAMVDPVEPFQAPVEPEPTPEPEPVAAVAAPAKPKRSRRKKAEEPLAEVPVTQPPTAEQPVAEVTTTVTPGITAATPVEEPVPNGTAPHANGTAPKPRRRRAAVTASAEDA